MLENLSKKQKILIFLIAAIISIGIIAIIYNKNQTNENIQLDDEILVSNTTKQNQTKDEEEENKKIFVHITGGVENPGVVELNEGSRIEDAIEASGGLTDEADISKVNLAYMLEDGVKIKIPIIKYIDDDYDEYNDYSEYDSNDDEKIEEDEEIFQKENGEGIIENEDIKQKESKLININKATQEELQILPGIGASIAVRIVEYREQNGKFKYIEDLKNVSGIGENKFENIKNLITVK